MEPFTIQCTTCQSKIRVRDPNLIHQIVKCPKCDSMLQVEPPQRRVEVNAPRQHDVDSMAETRDGMSPAPHFSLKPATTEGNALGEIGAASPTQYRVGNDIHPHDPPRDTNGEAGAIDQADELRLEKLEEPLRPPVSEHGHWQPSSPPLLPTEEWTSNSAAKSRQYLMVAFIGMSGIALAAIAFVLFLRWYSTPTQPPVAIVPPDQIQQDSGAEQTGDGNAEPAGNGALDNDISDSDGASGETQDVAAPQTADDEGVDVNRDPRLVLDNDEGDMEDSASSDALDVGNGEGSANDADAVGAIGEGMEQQPETILPKQLAEFAPLISFDMQFMIPDTLVVPTQAPLTAEEMGLEPAGNDATAPSVDVQQRMQADLPGVIIGSRTLSQAVNLWTHLSGIPTVVDFASLTAVGIDRNSKVRIQQVEPITIAELAGQLAQSIGAELSVEDNRFIRIHAPVEVLRAALPRTISLEGLLDTQDMEVKTWVEGVMQELFPELSTRWTLDGQTLQADLDDVEFTSTELRAWSSAVQMFEDWRSLEGNGGRGAARQLLLTQSLVDSRLLPELDVDVKGAVPQPQPVGQALSRLCSSAGLECWVDWANVDQGGLGPDSMYAVVTHKRQLRQVLADYVDNFRLVVAMLDDKSLWLTSAAAYRLDSQLYVLDRGDKTVEQWQQQLRLLTPLDEDGLGRLLVLPSPDGSKIMVRCCRPSVRL